MSFWFISGIISYGNRVDLVFPIPWKVGGNPN